MIIGAACAGTTDHLESLGALGGLGDGDWGLGVGAGFSGARGKGDPGVKGGRCKWGCTERSTAQPVHNHLEGLER